jgi:hypothetical protein
MLGPHMAVAGAHTMLFVLKSAVVAMLMLRPTASAVDNVRVPAGDVDSKAPREGGAAGSRLQVEVSGRRIQRGC